MGGSGATLRCKHQWDKDKDGKVTCILCDQEWKKSTKKHYPRPPAGDYITFETFNKVRDSEQSQLYKLAYEMTWYLVPRVSELNAFRPKDIDAGTRKGVHTINNYRGKTGIFDELPMPDFLHSHIMEFVKDERIKPDKPIIDRDRTTLYDHMKDTGIKVVNGRKPLHPHALRRGGAIYMYYDQKMPIAIPQFYLGHTTPTMTERYIGVTKMQAGAAAADYARGLDP